MFDTSIFIEALSSVLRSVLLGIGLFVLYIVLSFFLGMWFAIGGIVAYFIYAEYNRIKKNKNKTCECGGNCACKG